MVKVIHIGKYRGKEAYEEYDDVQGRGITSQVDEGDNWVKEKKYYNLPWFLHFYGSYTSLVRV